MPLTRRPVVLVVEDDTELRELYRHGLSSSGYHVVAVGDGIDQHVPVIVVTWTDTRNLDDPGEFTFVFRKPVSTETLARAIDAVLH